MSDCRIYIDLDNDAFGVDDCGPEVARLLRKLADQVEHITKPDLHSFAPALIDVNGNRCGHVDFDIDDIDDDRTAEWRREYEGFVAGLTRDQIVRALEEQACIQCYESETRDELAEALVQALIDDDIDFADLVAEFGGDQ